MRLPPQCQNSLPSLSRLSSAAQGNSPSSVVLPPVTKADLSPATPHSLIELSTILREDSKCPENGLGPSQGPCKGLLLDGNAYKHLHN